MSCIYNGEVVDTKQSSGARGGTEMMRERLLTHVKPELLKDTAIHFSRVRKLHSKVNIFYAHDLVQDPENKILTEGGWKKFDALVFVSYWQRDQYMLAFGIPQDLCWVIHNAIEPVKFPLDKSTDEIRFIYHTTPHRGLQLVYPIFNQLSKDFDNIHLDVFSSFAIYGWEQRDEPYQQLFDAIKSHPKMTYHGTQPNDVVLEALSKSHVFLYPSIWQETSCIAMIEAMAYGNIVIHPDLAALTETQQFGPSFMHRWSSDHNELANISYGACRDLLTTNQLRPGFLNSFVETAGDRLGSTHISTFAGKWNSLLERIHGQRSRISTGQERIPTPVA